MNKVSFGNLISNTFLSGNHFSVEKPSQCRLGHVVLRKGAISYDATILRSHLVKSC